ncbi:hypothetical protein HER10_EVM0012152 [Colletotrichum scovillei]|uniref:uncharacterized protein n=1 Tax=Colletotrichum scovillei TaxID=1209932 RepID=UPI0015C3CC60|nr:uncharacterized protein HER10_EVM0012152 [Colletotrichum scovillei]KAF4775578.1 hypothetical protein HER10_EVM0012152 [Colletotrichum scovillei]
MATDGSDCPENNNSTDCLLRNLLQLLNDQRNADDAEVNWDPISFAFSSLLGVAAATFALVTIWQAIAAAGKGWRKTNRNAIGDWAARTESRWIWSEMSYKTTAWTPILNAKTVHLFVGKDNSQAEDKKLSLWAKTRTFLYKLIPDSFLPRVTPPQSDPNIEDRPAATWVRFLEELGLRKAELSGEEDKEGLRRVVADYLPDDLPAAPAYAQVGLIVAATTLAGVQVQSVKKSTDSVYPLIVGRGFQLDFREHPLLGIVGVYSRYEPARRKHSQFKPEHLAMVMKYGRGSFKAMEICGSSLSTIDTQDLDSSTHLQQAKTLMMFEVQGSYQFSDAFISTLGAAFNDFVPMSHLFLAATPALCPLLFPRSAFTTTFPMSMLALLGQYWSAVQINKIKGRARLQAIDPRDAPKWPHFKWLTSRDVAPEEENEKTDQKQQERKPIIRSMPGCEEEAVNGDGVPGNSWIHGYLDVLHLCTVLLYDAKKLQAWFDGLLEIDQVYIRKNIMKQLNEIDVWLGISSQPRKDTKLADEWSPTQLKSDFLESRIATLYRRFVILWRVEQVQQEMEENGWSREDHESRNDKSASAIHGSIFYYVDLVVQDLKSIKHKIAEKYDQYSMLTIEIKTEQEDAEKDEDPKDIHLVELYAHCRKYRAYLYTISGFDMSQNCIGDLYQLVEELDAIHYLTLAREEFTDVDGRKAATYKMVERGKKGGEQNDIHDVIIYRCLTLALLFQTAVDSDTMTDLWDQVVPII